MANKLNSTTAEMSFLTSRLTSTPISLTTAYTNVSTSFYAMQANGDPMANTMSWLMTGDLCENDLLNQNDTDFCKSISEASLQRGILQGFNRFLSNAKENADFLLKYNGTRLDSTRVSSLLEMSSMAFYIGMAIRETLVRMIDNISDRISEIQWNVISVASAVYILFAIIGTCLLYTSPSPRDRQKSRMPSSA
eukprot:TRINITY_DN6087_c0_g2_i1.p1 TRINITY_DN6087_c0_g2~~TRINITY_DN6087_c0_g2_i1.p1  ORF type:complete len:193 (-),score=25.69 TRINITY_DN6087_c0_g2_i1:9-587(-)